MFINNYFRFKKLLKTEFSYVKWPRKTRLGHCNTCSELEYLIAKTESRALKTDYKAQYEEHNQWTDEQKLHYHIRQTIATRHPTEYMSLIIDTAKPLPMPQVLNIYIIIK
jgi:hypothetical protein